jgi:hypothetical protein
MNASYMIGEQSVTILLDGKLFVLPLEGAAKVVDGLRDGMDNDGLMNLIDKARSIGRYAHGDIVVENGLVTHHGTRLDGALVSRILDFMERELPYQALVRFLDRVVRNSSLRAFEQAYSFLEREGIPITPEGRFLAYKAVQNDWFDKHTGHTFLNTVGSLVSMPRSGVDDDPRIHCGRGLHVGGIRYVRSFACGYGQPRGDRIVIVEVDPSDVVCVPFDTPDKIRVCRYRVAAEFTGELPGYFCDDSRYSDDDTWDEDMDPEDEDADPDRD